MPQLGDFDWLLRSLLSSKSFLYLPHTLIYYRTSEGNVSSISFRTNRDLREAHRIVQKLLPEHALHSGLTFYCLAQLKFSLRRSAGRLRHGRARMAASALRLGLLFAWKWLRLQAR